MKEQQLTTFTDLGLAEPITRALAHEGYQTPTPIQLQTIPQALAGRDIVGIAQTGTGKTAAFALPILQHLAQNRRRPERKSCRILVLSPTRELSGQIVDSFKTYGRHLNVTVCLVIGGVPLGRHIRACANGVDVLVATPGRLLDLVQNRAISLDQVEVLVLDEADRMLDMGFIHDIRKIVGKLPADRQTLFFSATMPPPIEELGRLMLRNPVRVAVAAQSSTAERIAQRVVHVDKAGKPALLAQILRSEPIGRALVFARTKHGADRIVRQLAQQGLASEAIHGNKSQNQRERVLSAFRSGRVQTLVATDIAARGIDVDGVTHVINFDLPNVPESYVHRIGRTARAGAEGTAISFCDREERAYLRDIEKLIRLTLPATDQRSPVSKAEPQRLPSGEPARKPRNRAGQRRRRRDAAQAGSAGVAPAAQYHGASPDSGISSLGFMRHRPAVRPDQTRAHGGRAERS